MKSELKTEYKSRKARDSSESIVEMTRTLLPAIFLTLFSQMAWGLTESEFSQALSVAKLDAHSPLLCGMPWHLFQKLSDLAG